MRTLTFLAGASAGYLLGARAGRGSYDRIVAGGRTLWRDPRTEQALGALGEAVKDKAPGVGHKIATAAKTLKDKLPTRGNASEKTAVAHEPDLASDPALSAESGHDWSSEGGATPTGPATRSA